MAKFLLSKKDDYKNYFPPIKIEDIILLDEVIIHEKKKINFILMKRKEKKMPKLCQMNKVESQINYLWFIKKFKAK